jgi:hypothetical protein
LSNLFYAFDIYDVTWLKAWTEGMGEIHKQCHINGKIQSGPRSHVYWNRVNFENLKNELFNE